MNILQPISPNKVFESVTQTVLNDLTTDMEPLAYEDSIFFEMADDITSKFQPQIDASQKTASAAEQIAKATQEELETYKLEVVSAKKEALFAKIISIISLVLTAGSLAVSIIALVL